MAEGARVALVEVVAVLGVDWRVVPMLLLGEDDAGIKVVTAAPRCPASRHSLGDRDGWRSWGWVPGQLVQARV